MGGPGVEVQLQIYPFWHPHSTGLPFQAQVSTENEMFRCCWLGLWFDEIYALIADSFYRSIKFGKIFLRRFLDRLVL